MKTSVVIPTKNNAATIRQCLSSMVPYYEQGYIDEIVVVDAHSDDGTAEIAASYPVTLLVDEGKGSYAARENAWRQTSGDLLLFTDADTCFGDGFFPGILAFFDDDAVGIVSPRQRAVVTSRITRTIGEWWAYHAGKLDGLTNKKPTAWSFFQRLYQKVAWAGEKKPTTGGPCYVVRRTCLEAVNGFESMVSGDILLSRRVTESGWESSWWINAPFFHFPVPTVELLVKQRQRWGEADAVIQRGSLKTYQRILLLASRLGTPFLGVWLAIRYRNPLQLVLFPLAHGAWVAGYLKSWLLVREPRGKA